MMTHAIMPLAQSGHAIGPQNTAERMVWYALILTWPFYAIGALYIVGPVLGWLIGGIGALSWPRNSA
jgi:uncharacterized protein (DUF983 family)